MQFSRSSSSKELVVFRATRAGRVQTASQYTSSCKSVCRPGWACVSAVPEEAPLWPGVAVTVVRDVPPVAVGPPAAGPVELGRDQAEALHQALLGGRVGHPVGAPDDHGGRADHALGDPALLVLEEPGGQLVGEAELAV